MYAVMNGTWNTIFFLNHPPDDEGWDVEEGVEIDIPSTYFLWLGHAERSEPVLCRSSQHPKFYKVFFDSRDVDITKYAPTGKNFLSARQLVRD